MGGYSGARLYTIYRVMADQNTTNDTIAAISTPPGRGGIGIVRLSAPMPRPIAAQLVRLHQPLEHMRARMADVLDAPHTGADADRIDEALVTFFGAPHSYTAEDLVEMPRTARRWCWSCC